MVTQDKIKRPTIYTESDQILKDLSNELEELKSRMNLIEDEQEENKLLLEQLSFQGELSNDLISYQKEELDVNNDNYNAIANVMHNLKSPVSDVVDNLSEIITEIDDEDTRDTLKECMKTASFVLDSFNSVEEFCLDAGNQEMINQEPVDIREFFREKVSSIKMQDQAEQHLLRLLIDKNVPEKSALYLTTINKALNGLVDEVRNSQTSSNITILISCEKSEDKYGIELSDLKIKIENSQPLKIQWEDTWSSFLKKNDVNLINSGTSVLQVRNAIREIGGKLDVVSSGKNLQGFIIVLPLTF
ncbi:MAG: hypothetical protein HOD92_04910 [Deltaproteobacteria bacterium]|nr:hypothetical protein [Deltaproteobacteria bacterium]MBT4525131.1 hypothetical protein [Deltaproteobacteria bacterium]